jgi:hypothetical protein
MSAHPSFAEAVALPRRWTVTRCVELTGAPTIVANRVTIRSVSCFARFVFRRPAAVSRERNVPSPAL